MYKAALNKVASILENLPRERKKMVGGPQGVPKRFDMNQWYECGTRACAFGFAAMCPWFRQRGLTLSNDVGCRWQIPTYKNKVGVYAAAAFFDIRVNEAEHLFQSYSYDRGNRADVAQRIRAFVRNGGRKAAA